jgi:hypothetical protein
MHRGVAGIASIASIALSAPERFSDGAVAQQARGWAMAQNEDDQRGDSVVERGNVRFLYRPKIDEQDADSLQQESLDDVQRFYMVLAPQGRSLYRLLVIGRKRLPDADDHERNWGFVEAVSNSESELEQGLREQAYETKTRGERVVPAARSAGEGSYALAEVGGSLRLMYKLSKPRKLGAVQRAFNIVPKAEFVISIKNPEKSSPPETGLSQHEEANYPRSLQKSFGGRRFADELKLLDYEGAEFILAGARENPKAGTERS